MVRKVLVENLFTKVKILKKKCFQLFVSSDIDPLPKPDWADRAKKQIYRPSYVLYHYFHYSTVNKGTVMLHSEAMKKKLRWNRWYSESEPSEGRVDDLLEATMAHTKWTLRKESTTILYFYNSG